jgi:hypothetical protein
MRSNTQYHRRYGGPDWSPQERSPQIGANAGAGDHATVKVPWVTERCLAWRQHGENYSRGEYWEEVPEWW